MGGTFIVRKKRSCLQKKELAEKSPMKEFIKILFIFWRVFEEFQCK